MTTPLPSRQRRSNFQLLMNNRLAAAGLFLFGFIVLLAILAPMLPLPNPDITDQPNRLLPPLSEGHLFGTDHLGRDILARLIWGTQVSLLVGISATALAALFGSLIGLVAGYARGATDSILMRFVDMLMAFPYILLAIAIVAALGPGLLNALYAIALVNIPFFARNIRGVTVSVRNREFVDAARLSGKGDVAILFTEVLPNVLPVIVITMSTTVGWMILETAGLSFLGLGAQPPTADLGSMLGQARAQLFTAPCLDHPWHHDLRAGHEHQSSGGRHSRCAGPAPALRCARPAACRNQDCPNDEPSTHARKCPGPGGGQPLDRLRVGRRSDPAVRGVSFRLDKGECLGLIGESGSGKSVTALSIMGLVASPPGVITSGAAYVGGRDVLSLPQQALIGLRGARVAYVFQDPLTTLHPLLAVADQIAEAVLAHNPVGRTVARAKAIELMETVGIRDAASRASAYPHQLSGGQRQRIGIAMALANDPDIIIADEPTTALDVTVQARILELLQNLRRERGLALLLITHDFGVVAQVCDRVAVMRHGEIVEHGETQAVLRDPQHDYTKRLIACVPELGEGRSFLDRVRPLFAEATP